MLQRQKCGFRAKYSHGYAKGKMLNALTLACEFQQVFPVDEVPEKNRWESGLLSFRRFFWRY